MLLWNFRRFIIQKSKEPIFTCQNNREPVLEENVVTQEWSIIEKTVITTSSHHPGILFLNFWLQPSGLMHPRAKPVTAIAIQTGWLYCVECHNIVFGLKRSAICAQAVYLLHSTMHRMSRAATEWCQRFLPCYLFSVCNSGLLLSHVCPPDRTAAYLRNIGHRTLRKRG